MKKLLLIITLSFLTVACSEAKYVAHVAKQIPLSSEQQSKGYFKVGNPYSIKGRRYFPKETYSKTESGTASWYGPNFHGKQTANGEIFDKFELTAAHRTLQMPSIIKVTNLENGRSLIMRVNDRGPFAHDRVLDVSERGAELLGFKNKGTTKVKIQVLPEESRQVALMAKRGDDTRGFEVALNNGQQNVIEDRMVLPPKEPIKKIQVAGVSPVEAAPLTNKSVQLQNIRPAYGTSKIFVQAGSFSSEANAVNLSNRLASFGPSNVSSTLINDRSYFRVRLGPYNSEAEAQKIASTLIQSGNPNTKIIID